MGHAYGDGMISSTMYLYDGDVLHDTQFGDLVNNIEAQKIVIMMQQGYAEGFKDNLTGDNIIFYSVGQVNQNSHRANNTPYTENETHPGYGTSFHGEFNFHTYSPMAGKSPDYNEWYGPDSFASADTDNNHVLSFDEIYLWEDDKSDIENETSVLYNPGKWPRLHLYNTLIFCQKML